MKTPYRVVRFIAVIVLCVAVLVPAVAYVALSVTPVQRRIAREAEVRLSRLLDADVRIGSVGIAPFNRVVLRNVTVTTAPGDTALVARRLGAGVRLMSLVTPGPLTVSYVELIGLDVRLHRSTADAPLNIRPILAALAPKDRNKPPSEFDFRVNTVLVRSSAVSYDVDSAAHTPGVFNPAHMSLRNLRADISLPRLRNNDFIVDIKRMAFDLRPGVRLESLSARTHVGRDELRVESLALALPRSELHIADVCLPLGEAGGVGQALRSGQTRVEILPDSRVTPADLAGFLPALESFDVPVHFNRFTVEGNLERFNADLFLADEAGSSLQVAAEAANMDRRDMMEISPADVSLVLSSSGLERLASAFPSMSPKARGVLSALGALRLNARGSMYGDDFETRLTVSAVPGSVALDASGTFTDAQHCALQAQLSTPEPVDVGAMLADRRLGRFEGTLDATFGVDGKKRSGTAGLVVDRFGFNGFEYTGLTAEATLDGDMLGASVSVDNQPVSADLEGRFSLARNHKVVFLKGDVARFVPSLLNLGGGEGNEFAGKVDVDMAGERFENMLGHISVSDVSFRRPDGSELVVNNVSLNADTAMLTLASDYVDGSMQGSFNFPRLPQAARRILSRVYPALAGLPADLPAGRTLRRGVPAPVANDFTFRFTVKETERLADFFRLPVSVIYPVQISGMFSDAEGDMALAVDAPYLRQGNKLIEDTRLSAFIDGGEGSSGLDFTLTAPTQNGPLHLMLDASGENDRLRTNLRWDIDRERAYNGNIGALATFSRTESSTLVSKINLLPGQLTFNDSVWTVNPARLSAYGPRHFEVSGMNVHRSNQFVKINGSVSDDPGAMLTLDLLNFNLDYLFESLGIDKVQLGGDATGTFHAMRLLSDEPVIETPGLHVSAISYNKVVLGDALVRSHWEKERKAITLDAVIEQPHGRRSLVDGAIFPMNDSLDITFRVDHANVGFMQPYMEAFASDISGTASGRCRLWGNFKYIDLEGDVMAHDLRLKVNFTNTYYTATDSVHFRPGLIDLNGVTIRDAEGHAADLNGWVRHKFFKEPRFQFSITGAHNFLSYNETPRENPVWYGKIYGDGSAFVKGEPGRIDINVDMSTAPNSIFTFVLSDQEVADEYSFLTFRDKNRLGAELTDTVELRDTSMDLVNRLKAMVNAGEEDVPSDYNISLQMRVTPQAQLVLVMDPVGGDRIRAWGSGHLRMDYGSANNDLKMYGTYTLDRGYYNFTLQDVIIKDFTIKPGSAIVFNGDPYGAQLNIQAIYALNANLSDLDESFLQDKDLNRTNVPVHALMKVTGDIRQPEIAFDLEFPTLTTDIYRKVRSVISTDDMMNRQIIYLLALNRFYTPEYMSSTTKGNELVSVASSTISSQLSNLLGQISDNWNIAPAFRSDRGDFSDVEVDVALSSRLLNNRLLFNGNFGYRDNALNSSQFIGDFDLEYLLDREGRWRLKAYNRYNDQNYYLRTAKTTQGVGVVLKRDFDSFFSFLNRFRGKKKTTVTPPLDANVPAPEQGAAIAAPTAGPDQPAQHSGAPLPAGQTSQPSDTTEVAPRPMLQFNSKPAPRPVPRPGKQ